MLRIDNLLPLHCMRRCYDHSHASADELVIAGPCDRSLADQYHAENPNINVVLNNEYFDSVEKLIKP